MSVGILVVDDESDVTKLFRQHFRHEARQGTYVLHFAYSGEEALDKLRAGIEPAPIVIPSDTNMPVMDGLELLREIKTRRPELPVMMVTAYGDDQRRRLASAYGAAEIHHQAGQFRFTEDPASRSVRRRGLTTPAPPRMAASILSWRPRRGRLRSNLRRLATRLRDRFSCPLPGTRSRLGALCFGAAMVDILDGEIELIFVALGAAKLGATIGQHA